MPLCTRPAHNAGDGHAPITNALQQDYDWSTLMAASPKAQVYLKSTRADHVQAGSYHNQGIKRGSASIHKQAVHCLPCRYTNVWLPRPDGAYRQSCCPSHIIPTQ
jgi:hypothetical protein